MWQYHHITDESDVLVIIIQPQKLILILPSQGG